MADIEVREEVGVVSFDPLFLERERNRFASRAVAYVVWLNGLAAIALLIALTYASLPADEAKRFADAMLVFGAGSVSGLVSAFFAYISRTFRLERPSLIGWRRPLRWLAILAAIASAVCFLGGLNMSRLAVLEGVPAARTTTTPKPEVPTQTPQPETPPP
jgi:hypothetical protein